MKKKAFYKRVLLISAVLLILLQTGIVFAANDSVKVMETFSDEDQVKLYVRGAAATDDAVYQIDNISTETPVAVEIKDDTDPMRTLILLDNSISIPAESRDKIKEVMKAIIAGHGEGEQFRIATFADSISYLSDKYSDDYTALSNMVDGITHNDQDSKLTDVLDGILGELNAEKYPGYTRLIIISDGVNDKDVGGVTLERLEEELKATPYPVYAIGSSTGSNEELLDRLFMLPWLTNAEYLVLEDNEVSDIAAMTALDNSLVVYKSAIPEAAKTGGRHGSKLTLSDGTEIVTDVEMPFSIQEEQVTEKESKPEEPVTEMTEVSVEPEEPKQGLPIWIFVVIIGGAAAVVAVILILLAFKRKKDAAAKQKPEIDQPVRETEFIPKEIPKQRPHRDGTILLTPDAMGSQVKRYRVTLTDCADSARTFGSELRDEIHVGRKPDNQISISDDTAVHGHHCVITARNGSFYIMDLKDVQNHTSVNGIALKPGFSQLIVSNSKITMGRHTYVINIGEG